MLQLILVILLGLVPCGIYWKNDAFKDGLTWYQRIGEITTPPSNIVTLLAVVGAARIDPVMFFMFLFGKSFVSFVQLKSLTSAVSQLPFRDLKL